MASSTAVSEIAAAQTELLGRYYELVLEQSGRSFNWALIAAGTGVVFFLIAVLLLLLFQIDKAAVITTLGGGIVEVISGIIFYLYKKTSIQLAEFHTRLYQMQRFLLADNMCEELAGEYQQRAREALMRTVAEEVNNRSAARRNAKNKYPK